MEVECNKAWVSSSPESCNSQMVCPLFFPPFCPYYIFGIWFYGYTGEIITFSQCHGGGLLTSGSTGVQDGDG